MAFTASVATTGSLELETAVLLLSSLLFVLCTDTHQARNTCSTNPCKGKKAPHHPNMEGKYCLRGRSPRSGLRDFTDSETMCKPLCCTAVHCTKNGKFEKCHVQEYGKQDSLKSCPKSKIK